MPLVAAFTVLGTAALIFIAGAIGWVMNIISVATADYTTLDAMEVMRIIGIVVAPIGAILGWV